MKNNTKKAIIALSGGMDSCVSTAIAKLEYDELYAFHANYGQRTLKRELQAFNDIADYFDIKEKLIVNFTHLTQIGGSSLTDKNIEVSKADFSNKRSLSRLGGIPSSYVPFRNANILSACVSWAEVVNAEAIFIGAVHEDSSGYPDCRPEFYKAFEKVIRNREFNDEQIQWLALIKEHLIKNLTIDEDDFKSAPVFEQKGGLRKAQKVFGKEELRTLLNVINYNIAA